MSQNKMISVSASDLAQFFSGPGMKGLTGIIWQKKWPHHGARTLYNTEYTNYEHGGIWNIFPDKVKEQYFFSFDNIFCS